VVSAVVDVLDRGSQPPLFGAIAASAWLVGDRRTRLLREVYPLLRWACGAPVEGQRIYEVIVRKVARRRCKNIPGDRRHFLIMLCLRVLRSRWEFFWEIFVV